MEFKNVRKENAKYQNVQIKGILFVLQMGNNTKINVKLLKPVNLISNLANVKSHVIKITNQFVHLEKNLEMLALQDNKVLKNLKRVNVKNLVQKFCNSFAVQMEKIIIIHV